MGNLQAELRDLSIVSEEIRAKSPNERRNKIYESVFPSRPVLQSSAFPEVWSASAFPRQVSPHPAQFQRSLLLLHPFHSPTHSAPLTHSAGQSPRLAPCTDPAAAGHAGNPRSQATAGKSAFPSLSISADGARGRASFRKANAGQGTESLGTTGCPEVRGANEAVATGQKVGKRQISHILPRTHGSLPNSAHLETISTHNCCERCTFHTK